MAPLFPAKRPGFEFGVQGLGFRVQGVVGAHPIIPNNNPARNYEGRVVVWYDWGGIAWM